MAKHDKNETTEETIDKKKALDSAIREINKKMKTVAVMRMGDLGRLDIPSVPTGILPLDVALGIGGLPRGRIVEIYGPEASGKTTVTLHMIAEAQKLGGTAVFIDAEHALDPTYAKKLGVNLDELIISQPDNGEQGLEVADKLISSGAVDLIVIDSVAALVPKAEIEGEMGDAQVGLHARMMSKAMRKLAGTISKTGTIAVFINQLREKVSSGYSSYGPNETTTGGRALKFYSSVRLEVRRIETLTKDSKPYGTRVRIKVAKNKVAPPFRVAEFEMIFGEGYSQFSGIVNVGIDFGIIKQAGSYYYYYPDKKYQGKEKFVNALIESPETIERIKQDVYAALKRGARPEVENIEAHSQQAESAQTSEGENNSGEETGSSSDD